MIEAIDIRDPKNCPIAWWDKVPWLNGRKRIEFKPGLNIIVGPNGSGKTTVIKLLAQMLCCEQGGRQVVTYDAIRAIVHSDWTRSKLTYRLKDGVLPVHDGSATIHFNPDHAVGLFGGKAAFDDDFMLMGLKNCMFKGSAGQTTLMRANEALGTMLEGTWQAVEWKARKDGDEAGLVSSFLEGSRPHACPTALLDEPTRSFDLLKEIAFWYNLPFILLKAKVPFQVIIAAHSPFALNVPGANFIEAESGYLDKCRQQVERVNALSSRAAPAPTPPVASSPPKTRAKGSKKKSSAQTA